MPLVRRARLVRDAISRISRNRNEDFPFPGFLVVAAQGTPCHWYGEGPCLFRTTATDYGMQGSVVVLPALVLVLSVLRFGTLTHGQSDDERSIIPDFPCDEAMSIDRSVIRFEGALTDPNAALYGKNHGCYKCSETLLNTNSSSCVNLWTAHEWDLFLRDTNNNGAELATLANQKFSEHGIYNVIYDQTAGTLGITVVQTPDNPNTPMEVLLGILAGLTLLAYLAPWVLQHLWGFANRRAAAFVAFRSGKEEAPVFDAAEDIRLEAGGDMHQPLLTPEYLAVTTTAATATNATSAVSSAVKKHPRLDCLDTFRGMCLCLMIFVNYGGGRYWYTEHSAWNGLTVADLLFPWFMWVMGVSMSLSMGSIYVDGGVEWWVHWYRVLRRSCILFGLGLFLSNGYNVTATTHHWRIPGVLQYFGISYFLVSASMLLVRHRTRDLLASIKPTGRSPIMMVYRFEWVIQASIFLIFVCICLFAAAPGCPAGYNGPGGISEDGAHFDCTGGIHKYIDDKVFGYQHYYHSPTCEQLYNCVAYDPEGLLGSLSATTLTYLGLMTGRVLLHFKDPRERVLRWVAGGICLCLFAGGLCSFSQNNGPIPVNKNLWSASFVTLLAGLALFVLSLVYLIVDVWKLWSGAPFRYLGLNSILIYCSHGVFEQYFPFSYNIADNYTHRSVLTMNVIGVSCWCLVAYYCFTIKFFVKV